MPFPENASQDLLAESGVVGAEHCVNGPSRSELADGCVGDFKASSIGGTGDEASDQGFAKEESRDGLDAE